MRQYCGKCGAKVDENARFCGKCGNSLTSNSVMQNCTEPSRPNTGTKQVNKKWLQGKGLILISAVIVIILIAVLIFNGNGGGNSLVGTWTLQSVNGDTSVYKVGKSMTMSSSGKLYDNENIIAAYLNDEYTLNTWESSGGTLFFGGVFGTTCQARYSLSGNTLTINADGDKLLFRKR